MVGVFAFIVQMFFVLVPFLILWAAIKGYRKSRTRIHSILGLILLALIGMYFMLHTLYQSVHRIKLHALTAQEVEWIEIGSKHFSGEHELTEIVAALNEVEWFFPARGGWNPNLSISLKKKNGEQEDYHFAIYSSEGGAVIKDNRIGNYCGFSRGLPKALEAIGVPLPEIRK
jgi:hypothetical protein